MGKAEGFPRLWRRGRSQMSQPGRRKTRKPHAGLATFYLSPHSPRFTPGLLRAQSGLPWATSLAQSRSPLASRLRPALAKGLPGLGGEVGAEDWGFLPISLLWPTVLVATAAFRSLLLAGGPPTLGSSPLQDLIMQPPSSPQAVRVNSHQSLGA